MDKDLMLAVLAMNAYDETINNIGSAEFKPTDLPFGYADVGFFAKAYTYNGETIISYRGTDGAIVGDAWYGYATGFGIGSTQAELAASFYRSVVGEANAYSAMLH